MVVPLIKERVVSTVAVDVAISKLVTVAMIVVEMLRLAYPFPVPRGADGTPVPRGVVGLATPVPAAAIPDGGATPDGAAAPAGAS